MNFGGPFKIFSRSKGVRVVEERPNLRALPANQEFRSAGDFKNNFHMLLMEPTASGASVNEKSATGVAAVTACVGLLADMIAMLPCKLYRKTDKGREEMSQHPAALTLRMPSETHTGFELRQLMEYGKGLGGNGYARVHRHATGQPRSLQWLEPSEVDPKEVIRANGEKIITYHHKGETLTRYDVLHVRGFSLDGIKGISPVRMLRNSIGNSLAQTEAAGRLMKNGTAFPGFLTIDAQLKAEQIEDARREWDAKHSGARNSGRVPILHGGWKFNQTNGMSMADAQFLESRRFELQEIARLYRIPAFLIGDTTSSTTWGSGIEQQNLGFLSYTLNPHLEAWEQSLDMTLLTTEERKAGYYFRFNRAALMQVTLQAQAQFFQTMRGIGVYNVDEIRAKLDENALDDAEIGQDYTLPFNNTGGAAQAKADESPSGEETKPSQSSAS